MKTIFQILIFSLAMAVVQSCNTKPKENATVASAEASAAEKAAQDKKEAMQKREAAQQERLKIAAARRAAAEQYYKDSNGMIIYNRAEVAPSFTGGEAAMAKYFQDNLKYPEVAVSKGWEGTIYVDFVIGKDGKARIVTVTDETDTDADQSMRDEAIRCITDMPAWIPGKQTGKTVPVKYNLPVVFKLVS